MNYIKKINCINVNISDLVRKTNLEFNNRLSSKYNCNIFLKREDQQIVRSFKLRGAYNKILKINEKKQCDQGIICASAGNHAQGVAFAAKHLNIICDIYIPNNTPIQKINRIKHFSNNKNCNIHISGNNFDDCLKNAQDISIKNNIPFIHPYDDMDVIDGQATVASEIFDKINPDIIIGSVGGGGLLSGISQYSRKKNNCKIIGAEPSTCPSLTMSLKLNKQVLINVTDAFVDGATVKKIGNKPFKILKENIDSTVICDTGLICSHMIDLYKDDGIITEPAGALSISALDMIPKNKLKNKNVVCIISGGNNDITRYPEIIDRMLCYQELKHYYIIQFIQKPGLLKTFINDILGPDDDIVRFEYIKKTNKEVGNVLVGIEVIDRTKIHIFNKKLQDNGFIFNKITRDDLLYSYLI